MAIIYETYNRICIEMEKPNLKIHVEITESDLEAAFAILNHELQIIRELTE